jgi:L-fuconate dehydratase
VGQDVQAVVSDLGGFARMLASDSQLRWLGPEKGVMHMAIGAVINAAWDLAARAAGKPLWRFLADMSPSEIVRCIDFRYLQDALTPAEALDILQRAESGKQERTQYLLQHGYPAYTTSPGWLGYSDEKLVRIAREAVADGFRTIKIKVGLNQEDDRRRCRLAREAIGPDLALAVDANQRWSVDEAIAWIRELTPYQLAWIEEPTSPDDILGHQAIRRAVAPAPISTGEHTQNRVMFKQLLQMQAVDLIQIDAARVAGVNENLAILLLACKFGVRVFPHAGGVGLCELVQHLAMADFIAISGQMEDRAIEYVDHLHVHFVDPVCVRKGRYLAPSRPGFSAEMLPQSLRDYSFPDGVVWRDAPSVAAYASVLIVSLFFLWGVANNLNDILIAQFKKAFELSDFAAGLVQSAFYIGYFLLAIPASLVTRYYGYKAALLVGLGLYAAGAFGFYPAAGLNSYSLFLTALFVIASGLAFLETAANPLVTVLGPPEGAARRLNIAQSFNPLGSITGVLIGRNFIFSDVNRSPNELAALDEGARAAYRSSQAHAVQDPYLVIALVVLAWAVLIAFVRLPATAAAAPEAAEPHGSPTRFQGHASNANLALAVGAQFFYVGAQVGLWSYLIRYSQMFVPGLPERSAANFLMVSLILFMCGRFAGSALMRYWSPAHLLIGYSSVAILLTAIAVLLPGWTGVAALVGTSFFMSIMFPTIFALGLRGLDNEARKTASSFLIMAIIGGAVLTALMGAISDVAGINRAMSVPLLSFAAVLAYAIYSRAPRGVE